LHPCKIWETHLSTFAFVLFCALMIRTQPQEIIHRIMSPFFRKTRFKLIRQRPINTAHPALLKWKHYASDLKCKT
jgi:hypothetical protein